MEDACVLFFRLQRDLNARFIAYGSQMKTLADDNSNLKVQVQKAMAMAAAAAAADKQQQQQQQIALNKENLDHLEKQIELLLKRDADKEKKIALLEVNDTARDRMTRANQEQLLHMENNYKGMSERVARIETEQRAFITRMIEREMSEVKRTVSTMENRVNSQVGDLKNEDRDLAKRIAQLGGDLSQINLVIAAGLKSEQRLDENTKQSLAQLERNVNTFGDRFRQLESTTTINAKNIHQFDAKQADVITDIQSVMKGMKGELVHRIELVEETANRIDKAIVDIKPKIQFVEDEVKDSQQSILLVEDKLNTGFISKIEAERQMAGVDKSEDKIDNLEKLITEIQSRMELIRDYSLFKEEMNKRLIGLNHELHNPDKLQRAISERIGDVKYQLSSLEDRVNKLGGEMKVNIKLDVEQIMNELNRKNGIEIESVRDKMHRHEGEIQRLSQQQQQQPLKQIIHEENLLVEERILETVQQKILQATKVPVPPPTVVPEVVENRIQALLKTDIVDVMDDKFLRLQINRRLDEAISRTQENVDHVQRLKLQLEANRADITKLDANYNTRLGDLVKDLSGGEKRQAQVNYDLRDELKELSLRINNNITDLHDKMKLNINIDLKEIAEQIKRDDEREFQRFKDRTETRFSEVNSDIHSNRTHAQRLEDELSKFKKEVKHLDEVVANMPDLTDEITTLKLQRADNIRDLETQSREISLLKSDTRTNVRDMGDLQREVNEQGKRLSAIEELRRRLDDMAKNFDFFKTELNAKISSIDILLIKDRDGQADINKTIKEDLLSQMRVLNVFKDKMDQEMKAVSNMNISIDVTDSISAVKENIEREFQGLRSDVDQRLLKQHTDIEKRLMGDINKEVDFKLIQVARDVDEKIKLGNETVKVDIDIKLKDLKNQNIDQMQVGN